MTPQQNSVRQSPTWHIVVGVIFGFVFISAILVMAIKLPDMNAEQYAIIKTVLALAAAGIAAVFTGFIELDGSFSKWTVRAGGALAVFVIVFFFTPAPPVQVTPDIPETQADAITVNQIAKSSLSCEVTNTCPSPVVTPPHGVSLIYIMSHTDWGQQRSCLQTGDKRARWVHGDKNMLFCARFGNGPYLVEFGQSPPCKNMEYMPRWNPGKIPVNQKYWCYKTKTFAQLRAAPIESSDRNYIADFFPQGRPEDSTPCPSRYSTETHKDNVFCVLYKVMP